jgi:transposase
MEKSIRIETGWTIGVDLGDRRSQACVLDRAGTVVERFAFRSDREGVAKAFSVRESAKVVMEVGTHSPWVRRELARLGHRVVVANARRVRLISHSVAKDDRHDAEVLARLGRADESLLSPVQHCSESVQRDRGILRVRESLLAARTMLINSTRGMAKSLGLRVGAGDASSFAARAQKQLPEGLFAGLEVLLAEIKRLSDRIKELDRQIELLGRTRYPQTGRLRQVRGVGPITALAFVLTLDDPRRWPRSRAVGAYLGLTPKRRISGDQHPELRITKAGDRYLRQLLVQCAHYLLGPFGADCTLRRFGLRLIAQGGKRAGKRARVAVARKLAVLLHRLWISGADYEPLRGAESVMTA